MVKRDSANANVAKNSSGDGIEEEDYAEEFSSDMHIIDVSSAPSGSFPNSSFQLPKEAKGNAKDGTGTSTKKLEHAPPSEPMQLPGLGMTSSHNVPPPGAFPVRSSRRTATSQTREFTNEESKQEEGVPTTARAFTSAQGSSRTMASGGSVFYTVEAQRVLPDGNEEGTVMLAEAQHLNMKWYQRRWIFVGLALFACGLLAAVVVLIVLVNRPQPASNPSPQEQVACNFLSIPDVTTCRSTGKFDSYNTDDRTTGSSIPSEIGVLTQLTYLDFYNNQLTSTIPSEIGLLSQLARLDLYSNSSTSTIPSEIGLLTQLTVLDFYSNSLTSKIPTEIGLLTKLMWLSFDSNSLTSTIPSEIRFLTKLVYLFFSGNELKGTIPSSLCSLTPRPSILIGCGDTTCASGCCSCF